MVVYFHYFNVLVIQSVSIIKIVTSPGHKRELHMLQKEWLEFNCLKVINFINPKNT